MEAAGRARPYSFDESLRDNLLFARWTSCPLRYRRPHRVRDCDGARACRKSDAGALPAHQCVFAVLALCGCGLGSGFYSGLRHWAPSMKDDLNHGKLPGGVELPAPTAWPIVLAFGATLLFMGLLTSADLSIIGAVLVVVASIGWFMDVLPHERHEMVPVEREVETIVRARAEVTRAVVSPEVQRLRVPVEIYPVSAGLKGGLAGSVAMAVLAAAYGMFAYGSVWYPINLLAAVVHAEPFQLTMEYLT